MSFVGIAVGTAVVGTGLKIGKSIKQNKLANKVVVPEASYETSPYAKSLLEDARRLSGSQMPGTEAARDSIYEAQANAMAGVNRNATSGSQALAMLAATQGQSNSAFSNLNQQQQQYFLQMLGNLNNANRTMINEGDKEYQSDLRNREMAMGEKNALRGASNQNFGSGINDLTNYSFLANQMGLFSK